MNTDSKIIANFLASIIWADGEFSGIERQCLHTLANDYEMPTLEADVENGLSEISSLQGSVLTERLVASAPQVNAEEKDAILAFCLQLMGCDGYLAEEEISNFYVIANVLGIGNERAQLLLSELTNDAEVLVD